jgi:hypothetical protein
MVFKSDGAKSFMVRLFLELYALSQSKTYVYFFTLKIPEIKTVNFVGGFAC